MNTIQIFINLYLKIVIQLVEPLKFSNTTKNTVFLIDFDKILNLFCDVLVFLYKCLKFINS